VTEYAIETPIFVALCYHDAKHRYVDPLSGKKDSALIKKAIKKLFLIYSISDALYFVAQIFLEICLLQIFVVEAYKAAIYSSLFAWTIYFVSMNTIIRLEKFMQTDSIFVRS
jgi:hypothetical protein